jgi:hypothetical protein
MLLLQCALATLQVEVRWLSWQCEVVANKGKYAVGHMGYGKTL